MFPDLADHLPCSSAGQNLPVGQLLLVTHSAGEVDGRFVLHHYLSLALRTSAFAVLCALHHPLTHYAVIQRKLGAALEGFPDHFHFVDGFAAVGSGSAEDTPIATLWDSIQKYLAVRPGPGLIIVDDLTTLGCLAPRGAVLRFAWALVTVARLHGYTVLLLAANDVPEEEHLVAQLRHLAAVHCDVTALASGYSRDVSGLLTVTVRDEATLRRTTRELQYKALDNTVRVVPRGSVGK